MLHIFSKEAIQDDRNVSITKIDNDLFFHPSMHDHYISKFFNIPLNIARMCRFLFPRGRVVTDLYNPNKVVVEASKELEENKYEIAQRLNMPINATWSFSHNHYRVPMENSEINALKDHLESSILYGDDIPNTVLNFLGRYLPAVKQWLAVRHDIKN